MKKLHWIAPSAALAAAMVSAGAHAQDPQPSFDEIEDTITVRGAFVPDEKRATSEIAEVLDAEAFARQGDSDIAGALRRVTGLSIIGGRFVVARGLNERYTNATINGIPLPSTEPLRRTAPLDIIPTSILESSLAQKTYSPELSAEFGGAAIDLRTVSIPDENFLSIGGSLAYDSVTTGEDGLFYDGGDTDWLGIDDGIRDLPSVAEDFIRQGSPGSLQQQLDTSFNQNELLLITGDEGIAPSGSASATFGYVFVDNADVRFGTTTYVGYSNQWALRDAFENRTEDTDFGSIQVRVENEYEETRQEVQLNSLNTTGLELAGGDHTFNLTTFLLRSSLKRARIGTSIDQDVNEGTFRNEFLDYVERQVFQTQLEGVHLFPDAGDLEVSWDVAYGLADRDAPYERSIVRLQNDDTGVFEYFEGDANQNTLNFSFLEDETFYANVDFVLPLNFAERSIDLKWGAAYSDRTRENVRRDFDFLGRASGATGVPDELAASRIDLIYSEDVLGSNIINLEARANSLFPDASDASLEVFAAYAMADFEITEFLRASFGLRYEESEQLSSVSLTGDDTFNPNFEALDTDYLLPAVTLTWNLVGNLQVRGGYSQTITRPQFRELAATDFLDPDLNVTLSGNPFLVNSEIDNFDLRAEWYFGPGRFITGGLFYKDIENPIEQFQTGREGGATSFLNAPSAEIWGLELEAQQTFDLADWFGTENDFFANHELFVGANYTYSQSEVGVDGDIITAQVTAVDITPRVRPAEGAITDGRPLQGQSDHLVNLQLGLENVNNGARATLLLNWADDRILFAEEPTSAGGIINPAVLEEPPLTLDLVMSKPFEVRGGQYTFGLKVNNILADDFRAYREDGEGVELDFLQFDRGRVITASLRRDF
ncbi:MAG: TonB-dependent receptor [Pseudomonadota bacterium]